MLTLMSYGGPDSLLFDWLVCEVVRAGVNRQNRSSPESYDGVEVLMWSNRNSAEFLCWAWKQQQQPVCNLQQQFVSLKRTLPSSLRSLHHCSETTEEELYRQADRQAGIMFDILIVHIFVIFYKLSEVRFKCKKINVCFILSQWSDQFIF